MITKQEAREKASIRHERACNALEKAQERENAAHENLLDAIENERQESLSDICRPHGVL